MRRTFFMARQPLFRHDHTVYGYELLYRQNLDAEEATLENFNPNIATAEVLVNFVQHYQTNKSSGSQTIFVNFTEDFLRNEIYTPLPKENLVIDVINENSNTRELTDILRHVKEHGFSYAYEIHDETDMNDSLLQMANYIRINVSGKQREEIKNLIDRISKYPAKKIATRVETKECFNCVNALGFDYFQGFYLCRPETIGNEVAPLAANHTVLLNLINKLQNPNLDLDSVQSLLSCDPQLTIQLLKIVNSAAYGLRQTVSSITQAVNFLGLNFIRNWAVMLSLSNLTDVPQELSTIAMLRAKMCASLAEAMNLQNPEMYFTVGLFSLLEGMFNRPMNQILSELPLDSELNAALLERKGTLGSVLKAVETYEKGDWDSIDCSRIPEEKYCAIYMESMDWLHEILGAVHN